MKDDPLIFERRTLRDRFGHYVERFGFILIPASGGCLLGILITTAAFLLFWSFSC